MLLFELITNLFQLPFTPRLFSIDCLFGFENILLRFFNHLIFSLYVSCSHQKKIAGHGNQFSPFFVIPNLLLFAFFYISIVQVGQGNNLDIPVIATSNDKAIIIPNC